jgi:hypothetical protein
MPQRTTRFARRPFDHAHRTVIVKSSLIGDKL